MSKLLPVILVLVGLALGGGAALYLRGAPVTATDPAAPVHKEGHGASAHGTPATSALGYMKFSRPFIVPVVKDDEVVALAMLALSIEMDASEATASLSKEPKIRDGLMRVLMGLSHEGYFAGDITDPERFAEVRKRLKDEAKTLLGDSVADVLIIDYARQAR